MENANGDSDLAGAIEVSARTVDDAIAQALDRLGVGRDDVEIEVLHAGSPGRLLGFGAEPARIRVTPLVGRGDVPFDVTAERRPPATVTTLPQLDAEEEDEERAEERTPESLEGEAEMARLMLQELLRLMEVDGAVVEVTGTDPISLNIRGDDLTDLIGRRGETLRSIQFVLNLMVNKQLHRRLRVVIDVDGYRVRREELLRSMAERFAYRVRTTREPMQLETMPPNERRIIHLALADDPDLYTESVGEGDSRRVVIRPKR